MSRADEIAQGLRDEGGALIGGLVALDYLQGMQDFENGTRPPKLSSASYDLGRTRAREAKEARQDVMEWIEREDRRRDAAFREVMKDRPDLLAEYDAKMAEIRQRPSSR